MKFRIAGVLAATLLVLALGATAQAKCGKVTISEMNWDSAGGGGARRGHDPGQGLWM